MNYFFSFTQKKICSFQFQKNFDEFDLKQINNNEYAIKFKDSALSLQKIEDLIYQRDCLKSLVEKTFESLQSMTDKLKSMDKEIQNFNEM